LGYKKKPSSTEKVRKIGETLDECDAAPIVVGEATRRANEKLKKEVRADAKDIERAIDRA
jgi:RNase H-fold protein (predicted Holliday junction resolvase)